MTFDDIKRLDPKKIGSWPAVPKLAVLLIVLFIVVAVSYWFDWKGQVEHIDAEKAKEEQLRQVWRQREARR